MSVQLGDLSSVAEVGVGLFLALAIVQVLGAGGVSRLRRMAANLEETINSNNLSTEHEALAELHAMLLRLEQTLDGMSKLLFLIVFFMLIGALVGVLFTTFVPDRHISAVGATAFTAYYLALPLLCFAVAAKVVTETCRNAEASIRNIQNRVVLRLRPAK